MSTEVYTELSSQTVNIIGLCMAQSANPCVTLTFDYVTLKSFSAVPTHVTIYVVSLKFLFQTVRSLENACHT